MCVLGGDECAAVVLVVLVVSVVVFRLLAFYILGGWGWEGGLPVVFLSVTVCVLFLLVFCERWLLTSFAIVDGLPSLCNFTSCGGEWFLTKCTESRQLAGEQK